MKSIICMAVIALLFSSCRAENKSGDSLLSPDNLKTQTFIIDPTRDTVLLGDRGGIFTIQKGSFEGLQPVRIVIKEAYSPAEILYAGLTTESNGRLLKSAGMIFIDATINKKRARIIKPVKISIPNSYYDSDMQLFKGVEEENSTINWVEPTALDTTPQSNNWRAGKEIFVAKCRSCHSIFRDGTGPAMAGLELRGPWDNRKSIYDFISNPGRFMQQDLYTRNLKAKFGSLMTAFPDIGTTAVNAILDYIKNEELRPGAFEDEQHFSDSIASLRIIDTTAGTFEGDLHQTQNACLDDTIYVPTQQNTPQFPAIPSIPEIPAETSVSNKPMKPAEIEDLRNGFNDLNTTSGRYDFEIRTLGWYNVDAFVEGYTGTSDVELWTSLQGEQPAEMNVYLLSPRNKMLSVSNQVRDGRYGFDKLNGKIPLFLNDRAILFAFGSEGNKLFYGISEFFIKQNQTILVSVKETDAEEISRMLLAENMEGIDLGIAEKEMVITKRRCDENTALQDSSIAD